MTLEEIDHLFTGEGKGRQGSATLTAPTEPVRMSLEVQAVGDLEKDGVKREQSVGAVHLEHGIAAGK